MFSLLLLLVRILLTKLISKRIAGSSRGLPLHVLWLRIQWHNRWTLVLVVGQQARLVVMLLGRYTNVITGLVQRRMWRDSVWLVLVRECETSRVVLSRWNNEIDAHVWVCWVLDERVGASKSLGSSFSCTWQVSVWRHLTDKILLVRHLYVQYARQSVGVMLYTRAHQETLMRIASLTDGRHGGLIPYSNSASNGNVMQWLQSYECKVLQSAGAESPG